jgi:hypothetical protein
MWQCKIAPSLGEGFAGYPDEVWRTRDYVSQSENTVFFGLYGLPDFYALWKHRGKRAILWAGSDVTHFKNGYWLDDKGGIKLSPRPLAKWINSNCESWVENEVEANVLRELGIEPRICPSFLGDIESFQESFTPSDKPKVYLSVSGGYYEEYGWGLIERIAEKVPEVTFYLYGGKWKTKNNNVIVRGRLIQDVMDREIKDMQCGLRLNKMDGFSEITAKSVLWGQYPIVRREFGYPYLDSFETEEELIELLRNLKTKKVVNPAREEYRKIINRYPWNTR